METTNRLKPYRGKEAPASVRDPALRDLYRAFQAKEISLEDLKTEMVRIVFPDAHVTARDEYLIAAGYFNAVNKPKA